MPAHRFYSSRCFCVLSMLYDGAIKMVKYVIIQLRYWNTLNANNHHDYVLRKTHIFLVGMFVFVSMLYIIHLVDSISTSTSSSVLSSFSVGFWLFKTYNKILNQSTNCTFYVHSQFSSVNYVNVDVHWNIFRLSFNAY